MIFWILEPRHPGILESPGFGWFLLISMYRVFFPLSFCPLAVKGILQNISEVLNFELKLLNFGLNTNTNFKQIAVCKSILNKTRETRVLSRPVICWIYYALIALSTSEHLSQASQPSISAKHLSNAQKCSAMLKNAQQCSKNPQHCYNNYSETAQELNIIAF